MVVVGSLVLPVAPGVEPDTEGESGSSLQQKPHDLVHDLLLGVHEQGTGHILLEGRQVLRHETLSLVVLEPPLTCAEEAWRRRRRRRREKERCREKERWRERKK